MACEGNGMSDERIGEALIKEVIEKDLKDMPLEDVLPLTPTVQTEQEKKVVNQLGKMVRIIGDRVRDDKEFQDAIDNVARSSGSMWDRFKEVADNVFKGGITWEKIAVLFYVAGKLALRMVVDHLPQSVKEVLLWTVDFFKKHLLGWIREHGGWINSFSELAEASVQRMSSVGSHSYAIVLLFLTGMAIGSFITLRLTRQS